MLSHEDAGVPAGERATHARDIADYFGSDQSYERFRTHGRPIRIEELQEIPGIRVRRLEDDDDLQNAVLSLYHALDITFQGPAIKIVENHLGAIYARLQQQFVVPAQLGQRDQPEPTPPQAPGVPQPPAPDRAERRRQQRAQRKRK